MTRLGHALSRFGARIRLLPSVTSTYLRPAKALVDNGRSDEAEALLERGLAAHPGHADLLVEYAMLAHTGRRMGPAAVRWREALQAAPGRSLCHICLAASLRLQGHVGEASDVIATARARFPHDLSVVAESGRVAQARGDFKGALVFWERLAREPDPDPEWSRAYAHGLVFLRRFDEAEAIVDGALERLTSTTQTTGMRGLMSVRGIIASSREDWPAAVAFWRDFQERFPDDPGAWLHLGRAVHNLALNDAETAPRADIPDLPANIEVVTDMAARALLMGFESLGATCEFGLVQRRYGAEPLSLLRWNTVSSAHLIDALSQNFVGVGDAATTELVTAANGEFLVRDRRWGFEMHTWVFTGQADHDELFAKMCRRVAFLRDKFLDDLVSATKTFVVHDATIDDARLAALHAALRRYGPIRLLAVLPIYAPSLFSGAAGDVVRIGQDRFLGFVSRLGPREDGHWDIAFDDWMAICRSVAAMPRELSPAYAGTP